MNKLDTCADHQQRFDVADAWPPAAVLGPGTISYYVAQANLQRTEAIAAAVKYLFAAFKLSFNEPSLDEVPTGVDDSERLGSPKSIGIGKLRNAQF
jgi:hypothetical protein